MLKPNSLPIVIKIGVLFFALAAVLAVGIGVSSYNISSRIVGEAQRETMQRFSGNICNHLYTFMDHRRKELALTLDGNAIDKFLSDGNKQALRTHLEKNSKHFLSISYFGPAGDLQVSTEKLAQCCREELQTPAHTGPGRGDGYSTRLHYCETLKTFILELDYSSHTDGNKPRGSLRAYLKLDSVRDEFLGLNIGQNGFYFITTRDGDILHAADTKMTALNILRANSGPEIANLIKAGNGITHGTLNGKRCYVSARTVPQYGWRVISAIPVETYTAPLKRIKRDILLISLLIGTISVFIGLLAAYVLVTRPVSLLTEAVLDISKNRNFDARVPALNDDDIGSVARAFNSVLAELSGLHKERLSSSEEKLNLTEAQLRQAQKMEIVGRLAGGVAHDFNNLLTIILSNCTFLMNDIPEGDPRREDVKGIRGAGERAVTLTRQLLAFSRKQILQPKLLDLNATVTDTQKIIKRLIGEDIEIKTALEQRLPGIKADPGQIEQVILNLAVNARDAMPGGGVLHFSTASMLTTGNTRLEHAPVILPPGRYTVLTATDSGTGMTENTLAHLFEPFFTTKEEGKGTGLGLAMVYGIIKQSGGFIDVKSSPGCGAAFKIYFPSCSPEAQPEAEKTVGLACALKAAGTILLVEDDEVLLRMTSRILKGAGYTVIEAATARAALDCLGKDFKLLLTDVTLPDISGVDLAERVLKVKPGMPVIFTSGYSENEDLREILSRPENNFIQKPFTNEALLHKILEVIGRKA